MLFAAGIAFAVLYLFNLLLPDTAGRPVPAHTPLPIDAAHFDRWLSLFRATAQEICTPAGAAYVIERAERIAQSLHFAVASAQGCPAAPPKLF